VIYELGHVALVLGLAMALAQSVLPLIGAQTGNVAWMSLARPSAWGQFLFIAISYACLTHAFITNDFSATSNKVNAVESALKEKGKTNIAKWRLKSTRDSS
jgi:cytochrome c biogenesis factor